MQTIERSDLKNKINSFLKKKSEYELCPYGIEINKRRYIEGYAKKQGCFIVDEKGTLISRNEALPIYKIFVQVWTIFTGNLPIFKQYAINRSLPGLENLSLIIDNLLNKYQSHQIKQLEQESKNLKSLLTVISDLQNSLKNLYEEFSLIKNEKSKEGMYIQYTDIKLAIDLSHKIKWVLYKQGQSIDEVISIMDKINQYIAKEFSFAKRYFDGEVITFKTILRKLSEDKKKNQEIIKLFEVNPKGKHVKFAKSKLDYEQFVDNINKNFESDFEKRALPLLINK